MWTWHKVTFRGWDLVSHLQYQWAKHQLAQGENPLQDIFFTPQGWFIASYCSWPDERSYLLHLIDGGRYVQEYVLTFDEFEGFPLMAPGFFIPY